MNKVLFALTLTITIAIAPLSGNANDALVSRASNSLTLLENIQLLDDEFSKLNLSETQSESLSFQSINLHMYVNPALRNEDSVILTKYAQHICAIDSSTRLMSLQGITLYRGHNYLDNAGTTINAVVSDRAFSSTSISEITALRFANKKNPHVLDVVETGSKPVLGIWMGKISMIADEYEILLARNARFKITAIEKKIAENGELLIRHLTMIEPLETPEIDQKLNCSH